jgi:hypothetical protein
MKRTDLANLARKQLYSRSPELTSFLAGEIVNSAPFQKWMDRVERERPRGFVAFVRRLRGKERGITPEQGKHLERLTREAVERIGK